ncbi:MAG: phosphoesterase [Planctomycetes bacterium]|nr:phosphoesterase [Planctomycetota bacterium]MCP4771886.1 phosphoesterase [Planctomycetota bacterium]MCP4861878.1 phosphoesterase [Planctomycetota bacterium]
MNRFSPTWLAGLSLAALWIGACSQGSDLMQPEDRAPARQWIAGDHHIHSRFSVGWDRSKNPPKPIVAGDAIYPIPMNALMGKFYGLGWMVATDHGGPNHSKVSADLAYPELLMSRDSVPEVIQFFGMELDTPGADHSSLIVPHSAHEAGDLVTIEYGWAKNETFPVDKTRNTEAKMIEALTFMRDMELPPLIFANHPSRSAPKGGGYGSDDPAELRAWNDTAPQVAVGMSGAPGHQASPLRRDGSINPKGSRAGYGNRPTRGGYDQMTSVLGGFWDSMLGEGRRWWITASSDSHINWREGGGDFWPGEYCKTYVWAEQDYEDILDGLRNGRMFVTTGDLICRLSVEVFALPKSAAIGGELLHATDEEVTVQIRLQQPRVPNAHGDWPKLRRVDLIVGEVHGVAADANTDHNPTTKVVKRFTEADWLRVGDEIFLNYELPPSQSDRYLRVRGTNTQELEPSEDPKGEDPWSDLWFYSNPIFLTVVE